MHEEFIGTGWAFPMAVSATGGIAMARREQELEQAMRLILSTYPGERPMRPEFGCRLRDYVFWRQRRDGGRARVRGARRRCRAGSPAARSRRSPSPPTPIERNLLFIDIQYRSKATNDRRNLVFPFYTIPEEAEAS